MLAVNAPDHRRPYQLMGGGNGKSRSGLTTFRVDISQQFTRLRFRIVAVLAVGRHVC